MLGWRMSASVTRKSAGSQTATLTCGQNNQTTRNPEKVKARLATTPPRGVPPMVRMNRYMQRPATKNRAPAQSSMAPGSRSTRNGRFNG
jgi:hypothetical protein